MNQESTLLGRYREIQAAASGQPAGQVVSWYEELYRQAQEAGDAPVMARCLGDLAVLVAPHDADTALALTLSAAELAPRDAVVLENLAALRQGKGQEAEACVAASRAVRGYLDGGSTGGAACCLDRMRLWNPSGKNAQLLEELLQELVHHCRRTRLQSWGAGGTKHVLLLGDRVGDRGRLEERVTACRLRHETPVVITEDPTDATFCPDALRLSVTLADATELPDAVARAVGVLQFQRVEILAGRDPVLWLAAALEVGAPLAAPAEFLKPIRVEDVLELPVARVPELSVVVPYRGDTQLLVRLLEKLAAQTLSRERFEVLVVDDGNEPPLAAVLPAEQRAGTVILRQEKRGVAAARRRALERARGALVLFLEEGALPGARALQLHLEEHQGRASPVAILGALEPTPASSTLLVEMAHRAGLLFPYRCLEPRTPLPANHYWICNVSMPTGAARQLAGTAGGACEEIELGVLLAAQGIELQYVPGIECSRELYFPLEEFLRRCRRLGHAWVEIARRRGSEQPLLFERPVEPDEKLAAVVLETLLKEEVRVQGCLDTLRDAVRDVDALLERQPERRAAVLDQLEPDAVLLLRAVFNQEVRRGVWAGIQGAGLEELESPAGLDTAVVFVLHDAEGVGFVRQVLASLPRDAELLVLPAAGARAESLPQHPRLRVLESVPARAGGLHARILASTRAGIVVFLDGKRVPAARDWEVLRRFLRLVPRVGAVALGAVDGGERPRASTAPPEQVVATWRHLIEADQPAQERFLQRLVHKGMLLLEVDGGNLQPAAGELAGVLQSTAP